MLSKLGSVAVFSVFEGASPTLPAEVISTQAHFDLGRRPAKRASTWKDSLHLLMPQTAANRSYHDDAGRALSELLEHFRPHVVILGELWMCAYMRIVERWAATEQCRIVVDVHNTESTLLAMRQSSQTGRSVNRRLRDWAKRLRVRRLEQTCLRRADAVWVCSELDAEQLHALGIPEAGMHVVPNGVDITWYEHVRTGALKAPPDIRDGARILFPGTFDYFANRYAARRLLDEIYPALNVGRQDLVLLLVGRAPSKYMIEASARDRRIVVTGEVDDVRPYYAAADVVVIPLEYGSGTRLKVLEAFASGRPVVSTRKGAEGLDVEHEKHLLIAETSSEIALSVNRVLADRRLYHRLTANALRVVETRYSFEAATRAITSACMATAGR